ncbi:MAG: 4-(cytidine 5'-diphospho)-2-C-methyl-D-erythritol kinase [Acidobacteriota bacterium]
MRARGSAQCQVLRLRAHAKVNLALRVGARGADGYHPVATVLQTVGLADRLIAHRLGTPESPQLADPEEPIHLLVENSALPTDNTVRRAARLLAGHLFEAGEEELPALSLRLHKRIPQGAGLGGGSSDAATTLMACVRMWCDERSWPTAGLLAELAAEVGADVPFFLIGGTAMGTGRGDRLRPLPPLPRQWLVLVAPRQRVSTAVAYAAFDSATSPAVGTGAAAAVTPAPTPPPYRPALDASWMGNDLTAVVGRVTPAVEEARHALLAAGAAMAQMSGSGAASFGAFPDRRGARRAAATLRAQGWWSCACTTVTARQHLRAAGLAAPAAANR